VKKTSKPRFTGKRKVAKPAKAKTAKSAKLNSKAPAKSAKAVKAKTERKGKAGPSGIVVEILKLSSRPKGVTPAELNQLTQWKGAPWKWLLSNPKRSGYCDRWGYKFEVVKDDDGVHYKTTKVG
jgi:hypothetical protein